MSRDNSEPDPTTAVFTFNHRGFTNLTRKDYKLYREEGRLVNDGSHVKLINHKGPLAEREPDHIFDYPARTHHIPFHKSDDE